MADDGLSFLPKIKCSTCGVDIEISQLADHICATTGPTTKNEEPKSPQRAATVDGISSFADKLPTRQKSNRMPPPARIDPFAANKPFQPQNQLSPNSSNYSDPRSRSPLSPGRPLMNRSATSPVPRIMNPPSPNLSSNLDSAFPPFPTAQSGTPPGAKRYPREKREPTYKHQYANADPLYAPLSPRLDAGENVAKRMNNIAPGPFDGSNRQPSNSDARSMLSPNDLDSGHRRNITQNSIRSSGRPSGQRTSLASTASSSTFSNGKPSSPLRQKPGTFPGIMAAPPPPPPPPEIEDETEGIDAFLNRLQKETLQSSKKGPETRSKTYPRQQESNDVVGAASRFKRPSNSDSPPRRPTEPRSSNYNVRTDDRSPPRGTGHRISQSGLRPDLAPLVPPMLNYEKDLPPNPVHTPSDSGLSDDSVSSAGFRSIASSRSSPPASIASGQHSRNVSKVGRTDYMTEDPIPRYASPESFTDARNQPASSKDREPSPYGRAQTPELFLKAPTAPMQPPQTPLDPAIQRGLSYQPRSMEKEDLTRNDPVLQLGRTPPSRLIDREILEQPPRRPTTPAAAPTPPAPPARSASPADPAPSAQPVPPVQPVSKGKCRGCSEPIFGKSIKDSSGRLTGRYHKQCFVCRTCSDPFPTADFYVFDNAPYCEQHYHRLNGSLCRACNRGIEGQYLETDQRLKFHPRCFSCVTCRIILRDDYFEVGGRPYCERHAYAAQRNMTSLMPGDNRSRNMQKRRTRLMMM